MLLVLTEGTFAQYRRLDGEPFRGVYKVWNPRGSEGAFIGQCLLGSDPQPVLLIEGCVGLLEAAALIGLSEAGGHWTTLAATSSDSKFSSQPDLLAKLAGRVVCIVPDADTAGAKGAASWRHDLSAAGASVSVFHLPDGHHDLGTIAQNPADHAELVHQLFTI